MDIQEKVKQFFNRPKKRFLKTEEAIALLLFSLSKGDVCATEMSEEIQGYSGLALSDTILYEAIGWLEKANYITSYESKTTNTRGRSRKMLSLVETANQSFVQYCCGVWEQQFISLKKEQCLTT